MTKPMSRKIYLAADALWDLRLGTLRKISPEFAALVTAREDYYTRDQDIFKTPAETLDRTIYRRVFEKFKHEVLRLSLKTEILSFVTELCAQYIKQIATTPFMNEFELEINTYPFILTNEEKVDLLACLQDVLGTIVPIRIAHISLEDLTMEKVRNEYAAMIMYNYFDWLNCHSESLKKQHIKDVGLYVPRLYFLDKEQISAEVREQLKKRGKDGFDALAEILQPILTIQFLPIALFSAATPVNKPEMRKLVKTA